MSASPIIRGEPTVAISGREDPPRRGGSQGLQEFLVFRLATERMGIPLSAVHEILKLGSITPVPRAPPEVLGIISVRGRITTVVDLRRRLGFPDVPPSRLTRVLLVDGGLEVIGVVVDAVLQVLRLRDDEIEPASVVAPDVSEHVRGLGRARRVRDLRVRRGGELPHEPHASQGWEEGDVVILLDPVALLKG